MPMLISRHLFVVLNIISPVAGEAIALRSVVVRRGNSTPLEVLYTSSMADPSGVFPPMAVWAWAGITAAIIIKSSK